MITWRLALLEAAFVVTKCLPAWLATCLVGVVGGLSTLARGDESGDDGTGENVVKKDVVEDGDAGDWNAESDVPPVGPFVANDRLLASKSMELCVLSLLLLS